MQVVSSANSSVLKQPPPRALRQRPLVSRDVFRDVVEVLQLSSATDLSVLEIVGADLTTSKRIVSELGDQLPDDTVVGRIDQNRMGIVLPRISGEQVLAIVETARKGSEFSEFKVWTTDPCSAVGESVFAMYTKPTPVWKRVIDVVGASVVLSITAPILLVAAAAIKLVSSGPVLFKQKRVGKGGAQFLMYKLRTMRVDAEDIRAELEEHNESSGLAFKMKDDPRIFPVGKILRKLSIDELPQLWNVLRGEMSLVGPRPLPATDWKPTVSWHCRRHDVLPGLTGIWQVSGRSEVDFDAWVEMDLEYIRRQSLQLDCSLLLKTIPAVFSRNGAA